MPYAPLNIDGWRWVPLIASVGAIIAWILRLGLPESPRWLAQHGRTEEADRITRMIEGRVERSIGRPLPPPQMLDDEVEIGKGAFVEMFQQPYRNRTIMLIIFQLLQTVGYYGFTS